MEAALAEPDIAVRPPTWRLALANRLVLAGLVITSLLGLTAALAPLLAPHNPDEQFADGLHENGSPVAPCRRFPLGTDSLGRDLLSRVIYGTQISLTVGLVAMLTANAIGVVVGLFSGYYGGWLDMVLMRITDIMMAVPALLLAIALAGLMNGREVPLTPSWLPFKLPPIRLERGLVSIFIVIGIVSWTGIARVVRGQVLTLKDREFVQAARALGYSSARIIWRHIFPNVLPAIIVLASMSTAGTIALEAGLSYLGIGVPPPRPSWGSMISDGQPYFVSAPWLVLPPGFAVVVAVLGFNLLGQGLQDVFDPYQKQRP